MSDKILQALIKAGAEADVIEEYIRNKQVPKPETQSQLPKLEKTERPKRKLTEKQLAALAAGRAKNPRLIAKQKRLEEEAQKQKATEKNKTEEK